MRNSLSTRIAYAGIVIGSAALLITTVFLVLGFRLHIEQDFDALLFDHIEELVAESNFTSNGELQLKWVPLDPRFHLPGSGWYWQISQSGTVLAHSRSLVDKNLDYVFKKGGKAFEGFNSNRPVLPELKDGAVLQIQQFAGPEGRLLRAHLLEITFPKSKKKLIYAVTGPVSEIEYKQQAFIIEVLIGFLILFIGLLIAVFIQIRIAMKPLRAMQQTINEVHQGKVKKLPNDFPYEVQIVANELNSLLSHNNDLLERARSNIGNLAHAIKNPLTVIRNEAEQIPFKSKVLIQDQIAMIAVDVDRYLAQARAAATANVLGYRTSVERIVNDIRFCLKQLHQDRNINIHVFDLEDCWFSGEEDDLGEMVGNLMDNACKWTHDQVWVHALKENGRLLLKVEDNGPGIPKKKRAEVLQRGLKLDETIPGHGLGLDIAHNIAELYKGSLILQDSSYGGLCAILDLPLPAAID